MRFGSETRRLLFVLTDKGTVRYNRRNCRKGETKMTRKKQTSKRYGLWIAGLLILAVLIVLVLPKSSGQSLGSVNGKKIHPEELRMYAESERALVAAEYSQQYQLPGLGKSFWSTDFEGHTPSETLLDRTMEKLVYYKVLAQQCAAEKIPVPEDYEQLVKEMEKENDRRKQAASRGEVVYGIPEYTVSQYHEYIMTTARTKLMEKLLQNQLAPTEEQLRQAYEKLDDRYKHRDFFCTGWVISWPPTEDPEKTAETIRTVLREKGAQQAKEILTAEVDGLLMEEFSLDTKTVHREDTQSIRTAELLFDVPAGECSPLVEESLPTLYYLEQKEGGGLLSFEEAPRLATNQYINDAFEHFLNEKIAEAKVSLNREKALEALQMEQ